jgi:hypothetical protein
MTMDQSSSEWRRKGGTLSDKTARKEFGLTQAEIVAAIQAGKLQYRHGAMHGSPFLRLLRREVEALVETKRGGSYLKDQKAKTELARVKLELKRLRGRMAALEELEARLIDELGK